MRRYILLVLLLLLPLQFSWAAAASYCQHESPASSRHFGHHSHQHQGDGQNKPDSMGKTSKAKSAAWLLDADCNVCQSAATSALLPGLLSQAFVLAQTRAPAAALLFDSHVPAGPERPDRSIAR